MEALPQNGVNPSPAASGAGGEAGSSSITPIIRPDPVSAEAHGADGKFVKGNSGGAGRPKLRPFREAIRKRIQQNPEEFEEIVNAVFEAAQGLQSNRFGETVNQLEAFQILRDTSEGRPTQAVELSGSDEDEETGSILAIPVVLIPAANHKI